MNSVTCEKTNGIEREWLNIECRMRRGCVGLCFHGYIICIWRIAGEVAKS